jgi:phosphomannomutase/phosphoglucomutase
MIATIFREYDIRGIYKKELNKRSVKLIGYYLGLEIIQKYNGNNKPFVSIGYDARSHSPILRDYLTSGLNASGCNILDMGMVATPINYFGNYQSFNGVTPFASIMITGSHNPSEYNGFKITVDKKPFFGDEIYLLGDKIMGSDIEIEDNTTATIIDVKSLYIDYMVDEFKDLKGMKQKIILDCGNGVADTAITEIFNKLELNYKALYTTPDGRFPNHHPDPSVETNLIDIKNELKGDFDIGFAYDGDADRIAVLTKKHNIKGDILALLLSKNMDNPIVVGEVKCSQVMYDELNKIGKGVMYKTGHSNLKVKIQELNASLGAEVSGHIFFNDRYFGFDDALYSTLRILELINNGINLDFEIENLPQVYSTQEIKIEVNEENKFKIINKFISSLNNPPSSFPTIKNIITIDGIRIIFNDGWALVRASNTTPVLVTRFEASTQEMVELYKREVNKLIDKAKE